MHACMHSVHGTQPYEECLDVEEIAPDVQHRYGMNNTAINQGPSRVPVLCRRLDVTGWVHVQTLSASTNSCAGYSAKTDILGSNFSVSSSGQRCQQCETSNQTIMMCSQRLRVVFHVKWARSGQTC